MAANSYYNTPEQQQHLLAHASPISDQFSQPPTPLKPLHLQFSPQTSHQFKPVSYEKNDNLQDALLEDAHLKSRIRRFRILSRTLSTLISIGVLIPITMTVIKFLQTRSTYRTITHPDGTTTSRTAWANESKLWPTYAYFGVAVVSTILNFATIFSYRASVRRANSVSYVTSLFSWAVMLANVVVWSVAAGVYRNEKDKDGKSNDLWGWTCSPLAQAIQKEFAGEVDFNRYCNVQSASWYVGLLQAGAAVFTVGIYVLVSRRRKSKRKVEALTSTSTIGLAL